MFGKKTKIVTHNGTFHADDVFACAAVSIYLKQQGKRFSITRTRDEGVIAGGDIVFDVGGVYDPAKMRFDHHQKGGAGERENSVPYAAFGLVWKHLGVKVCGSSDAASSIDRRLVQIIDAHDNGINLSNSKIEGVVEYGISDAIIAMRPAWNEKLHEDKQFLKAVDFAKKILEREIVRAQAFEEAKKEIERVYHNTQDKQLIVLDTALSRQDILPVLCEKPEPVYFVYPKHTGNGSGWKVEGVRKNIEDFELRKDLPAEWAGLRDAELQEVTGVADATFAHNGRFLVVAGSKESALKLARKALKA